MVSRMVEVFEVVSSNPTKEMSWNLWRKHGFLFRLFSQSKSIYELTLQKGINGVPIYSCGSKKIVNVEAFR